MKRSIYIIIGVALLVLSACGRQHQAESVVKDFLGRHTAEGVRVSYLDFSSLDSTRVIGDSLLEALRAQARRRLQGADFAERPGGTLLLLRARYVQDGDTLSTTFYLDPALTGVVALKDNQ